MEGLINKNVGVELSNFLSKQGGARALFEGERSIYTLNSRYNEVLGTCKFLRYIRIFVISG